MSLMGRVETLIREHGRLTTDQLCERMPDATRKQVTKAAQNVAQAGRVRLVGLMPRTGKGQGAGIWEPVKLPGADKSDLVARIKERVIEEGDCWLWQGAMTGGKSPRPCVNWDRKGQYVRRIVWEAEHGPVRPGLVVTATCGNERCVSPHCVEAVTVKRSKQLAAKRGAYSDPLKIRKGIATRRARSWITDEIVSRVKAARTAKEAHQQTGVSESHAKAIRRGAARVSFSNPFVGLLAANDSNRRAA